MNHLHQNGIDICILFHLIWLPLYKNTFNIGATPLNGVFNISDVLIACGVWVSKHTKFIQWPHIIKAFNKQGISYGCLFIIE
jgi:lipoprotein signal peptidase